MNEERYQQLMRRAREHAAETDLKEAFIQAGRRGYLEDAIQAVLLTRATLRPLEDLHFSVMFNFPDSSPEDVTSNETWGDPLHNLIFDEKYSLEKGSESRAGLKDAKLFLRGRAKWGQAKVATRWNKWRSYLLGLDFAQRVLPLWEQGGGRTDIPPTFLTQWLADGYTVTFRDAITIAREWARSGGSSNLYREVSAAKNTLRFASSLARNTPNHAAWNAAWSNYESLGKWTGIEVISRDARRAVAHAVLALHPQEATYKQGLQRERQWQSMRLLAYIVADSLDDIPPVEELSWKSLGGES